MHLKNLNVHIVGLSGVEGSAIIEFLWQNGCTNITAHDFCDKKDFIKNFAKFNSGLSTDQRKARLKIINEPKLIKHFKDSYLTDIEAADLIFAGQAWYKYEFNFPKLKNAKEKNIPFKTIINLYLDLFPGTTIGITGTNGKTTTTSLIHHILASTHKRQVLIAGNIDSEIQSLNELTKSNSKDILVLEISNRQLKLLGESRPDLAVVTNITENHLDEHDSFEEYAKNKLEITSAKTVILNNKDEATKKYVDQNLKSNSKPIWFNDEKILEEFELKKSDLALPGAHNLENLYAALNVIKVLKSNQQISLSNSEIKSAIQSFKPVEKRLEIIGETHGIKIVNDLSSTTPISTILALEAFPNSTFSIVLGANHKGGSYTELIKKLQTLQSNKTLKQIFLLPGTIREIIKTSPLQTTDITNFEQIAELLNPTNKPNIGDYLIISPSGEKVISVHLKGKNLKTIFTI
ncbi:MAG: Mur ligase family protein [Candidatus Peregrinibacteria bacterium]|nr:Mur ligase family protein [Candidatus Peregrinibacteria bacterium]MDZ4244627.1 Mur ligase family protein [Candidatus Gracilibacteria bacterium]